MTKFSVKPVAFCLCLTADWWLFALIAILGLLVLLCLICIICYFCCGRGGNAVHPYQDHGDDGCCTCCGRSRKRDAHAYDVNGYNTVRTPSSGRDGIYFIPVKSSQVLTNYHRHSDVADSGAGYYGNTRTSATQTGRDGGIHTYTEKPSQGKEAGPLYYDGKKWVSSSNGVTRSNATQTANGGVVHHGSGSWNRGSRDSKTWKDAFNSETQYDDGDLYGTHKHPHTVQPSKPAKEVKAWMPHSKPLRTDHNTSTK
ncbi:hypothetical protein BaRGS_00013248 [Batillaria attramentaria]|uniref:Uncharacterized protein n=1 Tax=Batillaria attramentaria TaxID=370345 RepID=A0ABD0L8P4_9CAEN